MMREKMVKLFNDLFEKAVYCNLDGQWIKDSFYSSVRDRNFVIK